MPTTSHSAPANPTMEEFLRCWVEIDCCALRHNVAAIREHIGPGMGIMAVVKANAYGHGVDELARELRYLVEMFGVACVSEALQLRRLAPDSPILILGPALPEERDAIIKNAFLPVVSSVEEALAYAARVDAITPDGPPLNVHLKVDTGMGRIGVWWEEAIPAARAIAAIPELRLAGMATHLPVADEDPEWTAEELAHWESLVQTLREEGVEIPLVHSLSSAGLIRFQEHIADGAPAAPSTGDMVRAGLILYGTSPVPEFQPRLRPVLTWKSRITLLRDVPEGRSVSYGRTFVTPRAMRIATVAVGYADGYQRHLSNTGAEVLVGGRRCAVLGRVTMDQILVDVSALASVAVGDEAVLIGRQGEEEILANELAQKAGTIAWEIFTGISPRVTRHYITG